MLHKKLKTKYILMIDQTMLEEQRIFLELGK